MMKVGTMDILIGCTCQRIGYGFVWSSTQVKGMWNMGALVLHISKGHSHANVYRLKQLNVLFVDDNRNCGDS